MAIEYQAQTVRQLQERFQAAGLLRRFRVRRYEPGTQLTYDIRTVAPAIDGRARLLIERFVGGGFAGQVYQAKLLELQLSSAAATGLQVGGTYAVKILVPPSRAADGFRNLMYCLAFQGPFSLQSVPAAARAGALWQKLIRRGAAIRLGSESAVVDVLATFVDGDLGSCGEISEWVQGRNWRFEVDDHLEARRLWARGKAVSPDRLGSPEYLAKRTFMKQMVRLLHEMGARELARQYEWFTCKSQPNVLKRLDCEGEAAAGLTAVDFRPGLALLPFLPMSPGDFKLIGAGAARGSWVQFDRGDVDKLQAFVQAHGGQFAGLHAVLEELKACEKSYRRSQIDVSHNHVSLLLSKGLWDSILRSDVESWRVRDTVDDASAARLGRSRLLTVLFAALGLVPLLGVVGGAGLLAAALFAGAGGPAMIALGAALIAAVPPAAGLARRLWGRADYRRHYLRMACSLEYLGRALRGSILERLICWLRAGRVSDRRAEKIAARPWRFLGHLPLSILPARLHRLLTDRKYAWGVVKYIFARPVRLYFNAEAREQWLRQMIAEGRRKGMLTDQEAQVIDSRIKEPFIQKYLKSLAVHVCTLPVTQIVSGLVALIYWITHPQVPPEQRALAAAGILVLFQVIPISPGSLVRGLYVVALVLRERNLRDYNIAVFLGFFKYVGYLAFPIQMAYRYPALARFMAAHWATGAVHVVPVFGEHGALLEHAVFDLFYNRPLTIRRRMRAHQQIRAGLKKRAWHAAMAALIGAAVLALGDRLFTGTEFLPPDQFSGGGVVMHVPTLKDLWFLAAAVPLLMGPAVSRWAGGAGFGMRIRLAAICGAITALVSAGQHVLLAHLLTGGVIETALGGPVIKEFVSSLLWRLFLFVPLTVIGAALAEVFVGEPRQAQGRAADSSAA